MRIKSFQAVRPRADVVSKVASVPYDTVNREEARRLAYGNPLSFLHVIRAEIDLPESVDPYAAEVYALAVRNYCALIQTGVLVEEDGPYFYVYRQRMGDHAQRGIVACCHIDDYTGNAIRRHEEVRTEKLADRTRLTDAMNANAGPVFLAYRDDPGIDGIVSAVEAGKPLFDFVAEDGVAHTVWRVEGMPALSEHLARIPVAYIADGHHRAASAVNLGLERRRQRGAGAPAGESDWFLAVLFPAGQLRILPYNRCVRDLNGRSVDEFLRETQQRFEVVSGASPVPAGRGWAGMYVAGKWYGLRLVWPGAGAAAPLDVDLLQKGLLEPVLGIGDPRTDKRIGFVGGIRGTGELERRVNSGRDAVAFSMFPVAMDQVMAVADAGGIMPPKSTWFEPKLRSGMLIHSLEP